MNPDANTCPRCDKERLGECRCKPPRRLVLCFDGTGNEFKADETDSNIVKIYELLNREAPNQYNHYQPGIGTYVPNKLSNSPTPERFLKTYDVMFGTFFCYHVISGYQFLLRYYKPGDKIYMFGFSRGAYTARFLAEMIDCMGLLSEGNDEMILFAWNTFSEYQRTQGQSPPTEKARADYSKAFMESFKSTFCRHLEKPLKVYFLGLFDCVNSVLAFDDKMPTPYMKSAPAIHIRHAVSIHERRSKFQPMLFLEDPNAPKETETSESINSTEKPTLSEVWFAGQHGDLGGGWNVAKGDEKKFLLSDIPLMWMIEEVRAIDNASKDNILQWREGNITIDLPAKPHPELAWWNIPGKLIRLVGSSTPKDLKDVRSGDWKDVVKHAMGQVDSWEFKRSETAAQRKQRVIAAQKSLHDVLKFKLYGWHAFGWWFIEFLPTTRWELASDDEVRGDTPTLGQWKKVTNLHLGRPRPIPPNATKHETVKRLENCKEGGIGALDNMNHAHEDPNFTKVAPLRI